MGEKGPKGILAKLLQAKLFQSHVQIRHKKYVLSLKSFKFKFKQFLYLVFRFDRKLFEHPIAQIHQLYYQEQAQPKGVLVQPLERLSTFTSFI